MFSSPEADESQREKKILFRNEVDIPSSTYATYALYRYPAKFIPHVVAYVLERYGQPHMKIFDPFAGYGTVGIASKIYGYDYELWDLNPLLNIFHDSATLPLKEIDLKNIIEDMKKNHTEFVPNWSRLDYWYHDDFLPFLFERWGYYHSLENSYLKTLLTLPMLKTSRYFSYDDTQRQKLSKSPKSIKRIENLIKKDWKNLFYNMLEDEIRRVIKGLREFWTLNPKEVRAVIRGGIDTFETDLKEEKDILITSPPYLQSQEYIRQAKLDLYWLGYTEQYVKNLSKLEIPYRNTKNIPIYSDIFYEYRDEIKKPHLQKIFDRYFWGVLGALTRLQKDVTSYLFLFVGRSSMEGRPVPIDRIFIEHFTYLGLTHEVTLVDTIVSRRLFYYNNNPATGKKDKRTSGEYLVILKK